MMNLPPPVPTASIFSVAGPVRLQTLVLIRWLAVAGQAVAILLVHYGLAFELPLMPSLLVVGASVLLNVVLFLFYPASTRLGDGGAAAYLGFDLVQLAVLLYLTGGLENPFCLMIMVPVTISATILSLRSTLWLGLLALTCVTVLLLVHQPLPWDANRLAVPPLYQAGTWAAVVLGTLFLAVYAWQVAAEGRRMQDALTAAHSALAREQRLSALGSLAAAAAHELGTPLGTIAVVAKELTRELPPGTPEAEDAALLLSQAQRCREILAQFARRPEEAEGGDVFRYPPPGALVEAAAAPHRLAGITLDIVAPPGEQPVVARRDEIIHGLGNLIENAVDFAASRVTVTLGWDRHGIEVDIDDDGPGFNVDILSSLGDPYTTSRPNDGGMGLGVFIAKTLLEHTGATVRFENRPGGGAGVAIVWPRAILERTESPAARLG